MEDLKNIQTAPVVHSLWCSNTPPLNTDPEHPFWKTAPSIIMERDASGQVVPGHTSEVRSRWTAQDLYFLFKCPFAELNLKPEPVLNAETPQLWDWDVAEVFIGSLSDAIWKYKEFEMSPRGEWIDLEIDLKRENGIAADWSSAFEVAARIDADQKIWYGVMRIPLQALGIIQVSNSHSLRVNFFRSQGPTHLEITWQPPYNCSFHVPERFGILRLVDSKP